MGGVLKKYSFLLQLSYGQLSCLASSQPFDITISLPKSKGLFPERNGKNCLLFRFLLGMVNKNRTEATGEQALQLGGYML